MDFATRLLNSMYQDNIHIEGHINWHTDKFQRFAAKNHWNKKKHLFVVLLDGGASYGDWREPSTWKTIWEKSYRDLNLEEKKARSESMVKLKRETELARKYAIYRAELLLMHKSWKGATCTEASLLHPYVVRKKIFPYYGLQIRSSLVIKLHDHHHHLQSLQFIKPNGFKQFKKYASFKNSMCWLSEPLSPAFSGKIYICEGYATGCSIYECIGPPVVCAMASGNLVNVTHLLRATYPHAELHICADNDQFIKGNVGIETATQATRNTGAILHYPEFNGLDISGKPTDFNDLFCLSSLDEVDRQLRIVR